MARTIIKLIVACTLLSVCNVGDSNIQPEKEEHLAFDFMNAPLTNLTELQSCDILVKPNYNWLYGTSFVEGGNGFGHAMLIVKGAEGDSALDVLQKVTVFESIARRLPDKYQLRESRGFCDSDNPQLANTTFGEQNSGFRYRLRLPLTRQQKDSVIHFILNQDEGISSWRSQKEFTKGGDKKIWYCSLLVWEAFYQVLGIDLDSNGGLMVYPNDLICSPYFDNHPGEKEERRVRF